MLITSLLYKGLVIDQVACGFAHTLAVSTSGQVFSWGCGKFGQLGLGTQESKHQPVEIEAFRGKYRSGKEIQSLQCGAHHSALLDSRGDLNMWGAGEVGQLGTSNRLDEPVPLLIKKQLNQGENVKEIALGYFHTLLLTDQGRVL